ncbi:MAG: BamA/TamA family outer membrane protein [Rhodospirillales bacterium]|nr:BamA/TamA family outer membrane protein [Rhodospirillales bacterium]
MAPVLAAALAGGVAMQAWAQSVEAPGFRPGREGERFQEPARPKSGIELSIPEGGGGAVAPEAERIKFQLTAVVIEGDTIHGADPWAPLYRPLLEKKDVSLGDIYRLAEAITLRYRDEGYLLSRALVPAQKVAGGVVRIRVIEGYIEEIGIEGEGLGQDDPIRRLVMPYLEQIKASRPTRIQDLERYLLLINDMAGIKSRAVIRPASKGGAGASELLLVIERKRADAALSFDNYGSKYVGPWEGLAEANLNSALGYGERLTVRALGAHPASELRFGQGGFDLPLGPRGLALHGSASYSKSKPGYLLKPLDVQAETWSEEASLTYAPIRSRAENLTFQMGYRQRDVTTDVLASRFNEDHIRELYLNTTYDFADAFGGNNLASVVATQGLPWAGATRKNDSLSSRPGASANFQKIGGEVLRLQDVTETVSLVLGGQWQYALRPQFSSEEFALGGKTYGRGYDSAEIQGDRGIAGKVELRWREAPEWGPLKGLMTYGFYDAGMVWNSDRVDQGGANEQRSLASAGLGVQAAVEDWMSAKLELAKPLTRMPAANASKPSDEHKDPNLYFTLTTKF